ncbi:hypothetical protein [Mycoplasmopsis agalactiae]|uniref:Uncharacterized protein n=1 Tax=Mycoplasmopsis agalactiae TaxID=2110 RepID=D3VQ57_MYCAA|nr:hypothetical protein [Mycoplasmopsis agalactiae]KAB6718788.1 hypothetical protein E4L58_01435 [Mycoplasmopsis agalactiae]MCE6061383.1 hypothetical protein [Mycoplasmopsis agalactiae]CBH40319.1 Hypothetical protein MAGa0880 [Mycoplasmopsis agalactiae]
MKRSSLRNMFGFSIAIIVLVAGLLITDLFNLIAKLDESFKLGTIYILQEVAYSVYFTFLVLICFMALFFFLESLTFISLRKDRIKLLSTSNAFLIFFVAYIITALLTLYNGNSKVRQAVSFIIMLVRTAVSILLIIFAVHSIKQVKNLLAKV